jgi:hypothetical protein
VGFTCLGLNPAFLESGVVYTANKPEKVEEGGVVNVLTQVFVNQHSCFAESTSLVVKSCSVERVNFYFQVVKFV